MSGREQILKFLREPKAFAASVTDADVWRAGLTAFAEPSIAAHMDHALRPAQVQAWNGLASAQVGLVLGPPGTGKTHLLSWMIAGYVHARRAAGLPARVFVSAFTRNAIGNLLDAVIMRAEAHKLTGFDVHFIGSAPASGLSPQIKHRSSLYRAEGAAALADLREDPVVVGGSIWSLYRLLTRPDAGGDDGFTAEFFDLVCIDEASQMVLGHGLMALAGLKTDGRVVIAGDDRQLPPIRAGREVSLDQRQLGGSLYSFLKSSDVPEFALEETFRLNGPLAAFPERKFYPGQYRSAVETQTIKLVDSWKDGLEPWEAAVLDPKWPIAVLLHDGPPAATSNALEAGIAARLAHQLAERMVGAKTQGSYAQNLWRERLAVVSPHRAQNSAIRQALPEALRVSAFVETVDRIQGKERDAVVLSYCVADPEFALAEAEFIFAPERLNVAVTRARTKLIVLISRRLLDAVPSDQEVMDKAELLREFVFSAVPVGEVLLPDSSGSQVKVQLRLLGFDQPLELTTLHGGKPAGDVTSAETLSPELQSILDAVRAVALGSQYGTATIRDLQKRLATKSSLLPELSKLHAKGWINLSERRGPYGLFWTARPLDPRRQIFTADIDTARARLEEVISQVRQSRAAPFYARVRDRFAWIDHAGKDVFRPLLEQLKAEGLVELGMAGEHLTVEWIYQDASDRTLAPYEPGPELSDDDFRILNALEDLEAARINFGVFEAWTSAAGLAQQVGLSRTAVTAALGRLSEAGWLMLAAEGRVRSRMAELAREVRYVKQRFKRDDADERPYLVRSVKVELRDRNKPERLHRVDDSFDQLVTTASSTRGRVLASLSKVLIDQWGKDACLAGFQVRGLQCLTRAWDEGDADAFVIAADTGSGKTEAAALPLIACSAADLLEGIRGVRAVLAYPRIRLVANQAQRLAGFLAAFAREPGMPTVTLGLQVGDVPESFDSLNEREREAGWAQAGSNVFSFPFFACPSCGGDLLLQSSGGMDGADRLSCAECDWAYHGWIGSKSKLREMPPSLFLPTTDSLHQWLHDSRYGRLFGDDPNFAPPRAVLADEIHLYTHVHGAQVGLALQRLTARAALNGDVAKPIIAIGMSATLGDPAAAWGRLIGRDNICLITPQNDEKKANPRGREYFYFVQPEVESRGQDIAGASTTIQSLMCLAHGMRRRPASDGGFRGLVFLDSIDKVRRLHAAYDDAETQRKLASYRTRLYCDDPMTGIAREQCCAEPYGCDAFRNGECWFFAATDLGQWGATGPRRPGRPLRVADQPVFSGTSGRVENLIKQSDVVFTTSSLEVGYDDPEITLVYQHYAPRNLASFIQRKGRGGRGSDDRPVTGVTLSIYSSRDSWWFRKPSEMIEPTNFDVPLNPTNHFVRRGQLLATVLDALARYQRRRKIQVNPASPPDEAMNEAEALAVLVFGSEAWREFGADSLAELWKKGLAAARRGHELKYLSDIRAAVDWIPDALFDTINLPQLRVLTGSGDGKAEDVALTLATAAPGNATRRYERVEVYWRPPVNGAGPWLAAGDYADGVRLRPFGNDASAWFGHLPDDCRVLLKDLSPDYFRPARLTFDILGRIHGTGWQSDWVVRDTSSPVAERVQGTALENRRVRHDSRGSLRGFPVVKASSERARSVEAVELAPWVEGIDHFLGDGLGGRETGLALARVFWGADAEVNLAGPSTEPVVFSQLFTAPGDPRPLLHGYHVQTEGVRFKLNSARLDAFVSSEMRRLDDDPPARRWHAGQMLRFLVETKALAAGVNAYEARRGAELMVSAAGEPDLKRQLSRLLKFWSGQGLAELFEATRARLLSQHPLLSRDRVLRVADCLSDQRFQDLFETCIRAIADPKLFARYIKSIVIHSLGVRLKESFLQVGRGDERHVIMHVQLPIQFSDASDPVITLCEAGAFGDGTTRSFLDRFDASVAHWRDGFISECPNAREDAAMLRLLRQPELHAAWRELNPNDASALEALNEPLGLSKAQPVPAVILRVLYGSESLGSERFDLYDLAMAISLVDARLSAQLQRAPSAWELTSAAVEAAKADEISISGRILRAYAKIEDAVQDESLSPETRLADQIYRLHARLCIDGCQACVHQPSDLMSDSLSEASTSRTLLNRFVCTAE
jgi:hypothetical protein